MTSKSAKPIISMSGEKLDVEEFEGHFVYKQTRTFYCTLKSILKTQRSYKGVKIKKLQSLDGSI